MATTTIRVDRETHELLLELSAQRGSTLGETVREAADALRRDRFGAHVRAEFEALEADPVAWAAYLADAEATSVGDGVRS